MSEKATVGATWLGARHALLEHSDTPGLDAQLLLCEVMNCERSWLLAHPEAPLESDQLDAFSSALQRCLEGEALPYVLGWWEFYGRRFAMHPGVLIPRPETELLVEHALVFLEGHAQGLSLDVGTGSGCIAITLAIETPQLRLVATDLSEAALEMAGKNARQFGVEDRIDFVQGDLASTLSGRFDLICANLPYIPSGRLPDLAVARREPQAALDGGPDGMVWIRALLQELPRLLAVGGRALFEIDAEQADGVLAEAARALPEAQARILPDLAGKDRLLIIDRKNEVEA
jgi:release factor glutamine methyltransferase